MVVSRPFNFSALIAFACLIASTTSTVFAQDGQAEMSEAQRLYQQIQWDIGPTTVDIGNNAELTIPEGYQYTARQGAQLWNKLTQNPPDNTVGMLMPTADDQDWFLCFEFEETGYVKDDEKDELDADAIMASYRAGSESQNEYRIQQGWGAIYIDSWIVKPKYDENTNNLVWAMKIRGDDGSFGANHSIRLLGRRGVMNVTLVDDVQSLNSTIPVVDEVLASGFQYKSGHKYAEYQSGDKLAAYGLTGLIAGGAAVGLAKTGLLAKFLGVFAKAGKAIVLFFAAIGAGIWRLITGKGKEA